MVQLDNTHIDQRLRTEPIIWLGTVRPDGRPHLVPVWFLWDGSTILIYSQPNNQKIRNLRQNPRVTLALESKQGSDVVLVEGTAELVSDSIDAVLSDYERKYDVMIQEMGINPEEMAKTYSQAIRITPTKFTSWN